MFVVHCRVKPGGALNVLEALIIKNIRHGQSVDVIFTLYSDRKYLEVGASPQSLQSRFTHTELYSRGVTPIHSFIQIPIVTALPNWLNRFFVRVDRTKPPVLHYLFDYRNLMPFFPVLMKVLSWKLAKSCKLQAIEEKMKTET